MKIVDVFGAVRDGTFKDFEMFYKNDINQIDKNLDLILLSMAVTNDRNPEDKIIKYLLKKGIDINYVTKKDKRNALHLFYFCVWRPSVEYQMEVTKLLIDGGIAVNARDKYNAIPLKYAITLNKLTTQENKAMYRLLLSAGSDYHAKDVFEKSCLDYANEYSWRNDFIEIVEEFNRENK